MVYPAKDIVVKNNWIIQIKNEQDYQNAVRRICDLADAKPDTKEEHEFHWLNHLVLDYDERHFPLGG